MTLVFAEKTTEIRVIVKTEVRGQLFDGQVGLDQVALSLMQNAGIDQIQHHGQHTLDCLFGVFFVDGHRHADGAMDAVLSVQQGDGNASVVEFQLLLRQ